MHKGVASRGARKWHRIRPGPDALAVPEPRKADQGTGRTREPEKVLAGQRADADPRPGNSARELVLR